MREVGYLPGLPLPEEDRLANVAAELLITEVI
jgi:hypothetical protein